MPTTSPTATAILDAARRRFNERGYAASTLTEIASDVGISQGNLTYHFPTKRDLVTRMQEGVAELIAEHRARRSGNAVEDQYLARLGFNEPPAPDEQCADNQQVTAHAEIRSVVLAIFFVCLIGVGVGLSRSRRRRK